MKISQYADDNTCIVTTEVGIHTVLEVLETYGAASGAKLNKAKTKGLWMGRWRGRVDSPGGLECLNTNIKFLDTTLVTTACPHESWDAVITKFKGVLLQCTPIATRLERIHSGPWKPTTVQVLLRPCCLESSHSRKTNVPRSLGPRISFVELERDLEDNGT